MEDNRIIDIPGKHGKIKLVVPNRKPTDDELAQLHKVVAQTILNTHKRRQKEMEKATD